jgi:lipoprotein-anchoring transpeptidase ErfK/SrfK
LSAIARAHDVSLAELILLNRLENPDLIYVNQELILSDPADDAAASPPSPTPTPADPTSEPSLVSSRGPLEARWIEVDISEQELTAYEHGRPARTTLVSTGLPNTPTPVGEFRIWIKFRYDDMAGDDYYIEDVPYVMYFHQGYGLHGVTWHANFGHPMSHGCVNLPTEEAEWLFNWAGVGTLVVVRP